MLVYTNGLFSGQRPGFVATFPIEKDAHRKAQCQMFGAAKTAGLLFKNEAEKGAMLAGINQLLGLRLESRTQMTVQEMDAVTVAIDSGAFLEGWKLVPGFVAQVSVTITTNLSTVASDYVTQDYAGYEDHFPFI